MFDPESEVLGDRDEEWPNSVTSIPVRMPHPGRRTKTLYRTTLVSCLILVTVLGSIGPWLPGLVNNIAGLFSNPLQAQGDCSAATSNSTDTAGQCPGPNSTTQSNTPNFVGANGVPDLSLPKTVLSNVESQVGSSGVVRTSAQDLTLHGGGVSMRLLGGSKPSDELMGPNGKILSPRSFWEIQANETGSWLPLVPLSNNFTVIGTNRTGTFVIRSMQLSAGNYTGILKIFYKATSLGPLKWDLQFVSGASGQYRLVYTWANLTGISYLSSVSKQLQVSFPDSTYTMSWADVRASLNSVGQIASGSFHLFVDLGTLSKGSQILVDPSVIGSSTSSSATAYTFQRRVFYEPVGGYYWAFYFNGTHFNYSNSPDGVTWASPQPVPFQVDLSGKLAPSVYKLSNQSVVIAGGASSSCSTGQSCSATVGLPYYVGTISGSTLTWGSLQYADYRTRTCMMQWFFQTCSLTIGIEYVNVQQSSSGTLVFSYIYYSTSNGIDAPPICGGSSSEMAAVVKYLAGAFVPVCFVDEAGPVVVPSNSLGQVTLFYEENGNLYAGWINSNGGQSGTPQRLGSILSLSAFSAVSDDNFEIHVIFSSPDTTTAYAHLSAIPGSTWLTEQNIFPGKTQPATLTLDRSTGKLYAFAINGSSILMKTRPSNGAWLDGSVSYQIDNRVNPAYLGSNFASVSATRYNNALLVWTEGTPNYPCYCYNVTFASIPIQRVWSPYSSPTDPWNGAGLAPYGQYFQNLGEFVFPSTGMLTVKQTDLTVPGRGLNLEFTRVYIEPYSFSNNVALNDSNSWIPMANGWQLNFPWLSRAPTPLVIHLQDGQGYRIPSSFWSGFTSTFDNHQGLNFRLVRYISGNITLYFGTGTSYNYDSTHKLNTIKDSTGNNTITFSYANDIVSCITDTAGRAFTLTYSSGLLSTIAQVAGTCSSPGSSLRSVSYTNNAQSLSSVTDPGGRTTYYSYNATGSPTVAAWLLSRIRYPTTWLTNYTYTPVTLGAGTITYRINLQKSGPSASSPVRQFQYSYNNPVGDQITSASVEAINGTQPASYTKYAFSFLGDTRNVTDASGRFLSGTQQLFGVDGEIPREVVLVTDGQHIGSYTNYYSYDLWGNQIYSRRVINSAANTGHDSFTAHYADGEYPGFYAFQDTFSQDKGTQSDNSWNVTNGFWRVTNGAYNGTETNGQQESMFSSASLNQTDLSLQARIYIARPINASDQRVGIFVHHSTANYKWMLVLHNATAGQYYLQLTDESYGGWPALNDPGSYSCLMVYNTWWTFNMTVHGTNLVGWATNPSRTTACSVSRTLSSSSPAIGGKGFGLYAGGFSALFDDVLVTTVSPFITGTGFSNSFVQSGSPGPIGLNTWLATTKPPGPGWNTTKNWLPASSWSQAIASQNYGGTPWNQWFNNFPDNNAQWIWWSSYANVSASTDPVWFRQVFTAPASTNLNVAIVADNTYVVYLDGTRIGYQLNPNNWATLGSYSATLTGGPYHILAINATNTDGPAGLIVSVKNTGTNQVIFRSDATGGPAMTSPAGSAQLQNGAFSAPQESYYSYYPWGGLNQTKTRYDPPSPIAFDGSTFSACGKTTTVCTTTLSTSHSNDTVIVYAMTTLGGACTFTVKDSANLVWASRTGIITARSGEDRFQEFYAKSSNPLFADRINETISGCGPIYNSIQALAVSGANFGTPFDPSSGSPGTNSANINGATTNVTITTSNPSDLIVASLQHGTFAVPSAQTGFTGIFLFQGYGSEYTISHATLSNYLVSFGFNPCVFCPWEEIADALQPSGTALPTQWITSTRTYDNYGNLGTLTDLRGNVTSYTYSSSYSNAYPTNVTQTLKPGSVQITTTYTYNFTVGAPTSVVDGRGNSTTYQYDNLGRVKRVVYPTGDYVNYAYNDVGNFVDITNENLMKSRQVFDGLGRLSTSERFTGGTGGGVPYSNETYTYNWLSNVVNRLDSLGNLYNYTYDALGRTLQAKKPDGTLTRVSYNDQQAYVITTDEYGNDRCNTYDRLGRLLSVVEYSNSTCGPLLLSGSSYVTNYSYDEVGNLRQVNNAIGVTTLYAYDNLNRLTITNYPDGTSETNTYDNDGNILSKVGRDSFKTLSAYDSINRPIITTYCGSTSSGTTGNSYIYDKNSNLVSLKNQNATLSYRYDSRNRTLNETYSVNPTTRTITDLGCSGTGGTLTRSGGGSKTVSFTYSYKGELLSGILYPTTNSQKPNIAVNYTYDALGRILNVSSAYVSFAKISYYRNDEIKGIQYGNGLWMNYTYDPVGRVMLEQLNNTSTHSTLLRLAYVYNSTGTVASLIGQVNQVKVNEQYRYDPLRRLVNSNITSQGTNQRIAYSYDTLGNRLSQTVNSTVTNYSYNYLINELTSAGTTSYTYDAKGNQLSKTVGSVSWTYTWDKSNRLLMVSNTTTQGRYAYDGLGRQVEGREGSQTNFFAYLGTSTLWKNGTDYVYAGSQLVAFTSDNLSYHTPRYYHTDALGSVRLMTKDDATVWNANGYLPFGQDNGNPTCPSCPTSPPLKFDGKPFSASTGLYYDYQRWYDPSLGRFISSDTGYLSLANPQSLNRYIALLNSPTNYVDPDGASPLRSYGAIATNLAALFEWLARPQRIPGTTYDVHWGGFRPDPFHTIVEVRDPTARVGQSMTVYALDRPSIQDPFYHQGGRNDAGAFVHDEFDNPVDPTIGVPAEGIGRMAVLEGASHALLALGVAVSALDIASAYQADSQAGSGYPRTTQAVAEQAAGWAGAYAGAEILGGYGLEFGFELGGPPGAIVGGIVGGAVGSIVGFAYGQQAVDNLIGPGAQGPYNGPPPCNAFGIEGSVFQNPGAYCSSSSEL